TIDDITGSETVDLAANSSKNIESNKVPHQVQQQTSSGSGGGKKGGNKGPKSITQQEIKGVYVVAKIGDTIVAGPYEDPPDIKATMDEKEKNGGDSDTSDSMPGFDDMDNGSSSSSSSDSSSN
ncbi:MAG: hypothetical protein ABSH19_05580, partial [Opitutales bacterium]